jgi:hypothetical protein
MNYLSTTQRLLLAGTLASSFVFAAGPLDNACLGGLFKRAESDPKDHPLPPVQKLEQLVEKNSFKIVDTRNQERFAMPVYKAHPAAGNPVLMDMSAELPDDGKTLVVPVDLTGSGVSDLLYSRKDWGGWKVLSNGARLPRPFQGFMAGLVEPGKESASLAAIPVSTHDIAVDTDLLAVVGDFLGTGSEQLAYTRPGWTYFWVVGCAGAVQMSADLTGIVNNGSGVQVHWMFPFKQAKGVKHTRIAYYRLGNSELATFAPQGMGFKRDQAPLKGNWEKLSQNVLDWPREAPGKVQQKVEEVKDAFGQLTGKD